MTDSLDSSIEQISDIMDYKEFQEINDFMDDPNVEKGLLKLTSILSKPEINPSHVSRHVVECEALSVAYGLKARYYMQMGKDQPNSKEKKAYYMAMKEYFHNLAASLKYVVKTSI